MVTYALRRAFLIMELMPEHSVAVLLLAAEGFFLAPLRSTGALLIRPILGADDLEL